MFDTAIIADSACCMPKSIAKKYGITCVPVSYSINGTRHKDPMNAVKIVELFTSGAFGKKNDVETFAPTVEEFEDAIETKIRQGYKRVLVQTVNRTQGETYTNANKAVSNVKHRLRNRSILVRVMDSRTVFAGQALMAIETVRRLLREKSEDIARRKMDVLSTKIHTFILPKNIRESGQRAAKRNEEYSRSKAFIATMLDIYPIYRNYNDSSQMVKTVRGFDNAVKALFEHACSRIDKGLYSPIMTIHYAGPMAELKSLPGFEELEAVTKARNVILSPSVASIAGGVYSSVGSLSLALATDDHEWL